jgi:hypothetical protein
MPCTVCNHPQRQAIDLALLDRTATLAQLSGQHHLSTSALHRHKQHLLHKMARVQNRFQDLLQESYLFILNEFLASVHRAAQTASAAGDSRQLLQAVRQGTGIIKLMAKLGASLTADTIQRLLASPQWAESGKLLPTDPQFVAACHQALADSLFSPCPEPGSEDAPLAAGQLDAAALAELADLHPDLLPLLAGLSPSPSSPGCGPQPAKREKNRPKSGKLPGKKSSPGKFNKEIQNVTLSEKISPPPSASPWLEPGATTGSGNWIEDLDAGRLNADFLNAIAVGRQPLEPCVLSPAPRATTVCP